MDFNVRRNRSSVFPSLVLLFLVLNIPYSKSEQPSRKDGLPLPSDSNPYEDEDYRLDTYWDGDPIGDTVPEFNATANRTSSEETNLPLIIAITPTYNRATQALHITNLVNALRLVPPPLLWIVVESFYPSGETRMLLQRTAGRCLKIAGQSECTKLNYLHIAADGHEDFTQSRGVVQRNKALEYIEKEKLKGIVYFMDDDNTYSQEVFEEIRKVKRVGIWPVGFVWSKEFYAATGWRFPPGVERPLVRVAEDGRSHVIGWETFPWMVVKEGMLLRKFHSDMAGFAFSSELLWEPTNATTKRPKHPIRFIPKFSLIESTFLDRLVSRASDLEPLANNCQDVLVWHTKMEAGLGDSYPLTWRLPQPSPLVPDVDNKKTPRYIVRRKRYYLLGYNKSYPYGYKKMYG